MRSAQESERRLLVTGAGGFVGRHAMAAFAASLRSGDRLAGIGREPMPDMPSAAQAYRLDLLDRSVLDAALAGYRPTHVLHLAAQSSVHQASGAAAQTWRVNLVGLLNLAEAVIAHAPQAQVLFVSSGEVYGRAFLSGVPLDESVEPSPANAYARTKRAGEQMLGDVLGTAGIRHLVLRPFNHIGPGQDERFVVPSFAAQIARIEAGRVPPVLEVGDLTAQRDFLDIGDVIAAYGAVIEAGRMLPDAAVFNVASGRSRAIGDILDLLRAQARVPFEVRQVPERMRPSEIPVAAGDASALACAVGWSPAVPLEDSVGRVLDAARARIATA